MTEALALPRFGDELDELRRAAGLSYRELARRAGVDASHLCCLVRGRRGHHPRDELIERVAAALGVRADSFQEYRHRRALELYPDAVDELYRRRAG